MQRDVQFIVPAQLPGNAPTEVTDTVKDYLQPVPGSDRQKKVLL
jgi:hypothetical protein